MKKKDEIRGLFPDQDITAPWWASKSRRLVETGAENDFGKVVSCGLALITEENLPL